MKKHILQENYERFFGYVLTEGNYTTNTKTHKEFKRNLDKLVSKIQSHWGGGAAKRLAEPSSEIIRLFPIFTKLKQKFGRDNFLTTRITFKDKKKSPVKWVEVIGYFTKSDDKISKSISGFDVVPSEGWKNKRFFDYQIKNDIQLKDFIKDIEEEFWNNK